MDPMKGLVLWMIDYCKAHASFPSNVKGCSTNVLIGIVSQSGCYLHNGSV